jgi:hypothetical protein
MSTVMERRAPRMTKLTLHFLRADKIRARGLAAARAFHILSRREPLLAVKKPVFHSHGLQCLSGEFLVRRKV